MPLLVNELIGTLQSYETKKLNEENESKGKKSIALKSNIDSKDAYSEDEDVDDEELALFIKKYKKMKIKGRNLKGKKPFEKKNALDEKSKEVICFHCRKRGHIKPNCPLLKKKTKFEKAKKALKVETLSDTKCEDNDEDIANFCLMANTNSDSDYDDKS